MGISADIVLDELAQASGLTPARLYGIALGQSGAGGAGIGFGRLTLRRYCEQIGLDVDTAIQRLKGEGFQTEPETTIRAIADSTGAHPSRVRTILDASTSQ